MLSLSSATVIFQSNVKKNGIHTQFYTKQHRTEKQDKKQRNTASTVFDISPSIHTFNWATAPFSLGSSKNYKQKTEK